MPSFNSMRSTRSGRFGQDSQNARGRRQEQLEHLISATGGLGPIFLLFRVYLSTRIDLFSDNECQDLAVVSPHIALTPFADVREHIEQELGRPVDQMFLAVEPTPYTATVLTVSYLALLHSGESVSITTLRQEFVTWPWERIDALRLLCSTALPKDWTKSVSVQVVASFEQELRERLDLYVRAENMNALAKDAADSEVLCAPTVRLELCRPRLLVTEKISLVRLSEVITDFIRSERGKYSETPNLAGFSPDRLASVLCTAWLREVFLGHCFPVYCRAEDVFVRADRRIAFVNGPYFKLPADAEERVWKYLLAVVEDNPDECCRSLLLQTVGDVDEEKQRDLIAQFRQSVTFFQAKPGEEALQTGTAARIWHHLEIVNNAGLRLRPSVLNFYRGLFTLLTGVRCLHLERDPLLEAIEDVWATGIVSSFKQMMRGDVVTDMANRYAATTIEIPRRMNEILTTFAAGSEDDRDDSPASRNKPEGSNSSRITALLLFAAVLILVRSPTLQIPVLWVDRVTFSICCLAGLVALKIASSG
jgi:predicted unusual protein kinase regulating ubiquinone biosynthesis (AarF/ABC1/UbiB family)